MLLEDQFWTVESQIIWDKFNMGNKWIKISFFNVIPKNVGMDKYKDLT